MRRVNRIGMDIGGSAYDPDKRSEYELEEARQLEELNLEMERKRDHLARRMRKGQLSQNEWYQAVQKRDWALAHANLQWKAQQGVVNKLCRRVAELERQIREAEDG